MSRSIRLPLYQRGSRSLHGGKEKVRDGRNILSQKDVRRPRCRHCRADGVKVSGRRSPEPGRCGDVWLTEAVGSRIPGLVGTSRPRDSSQNATSASAHTLRRSPDASDMARRELDFAAPSHRRSKATRSYRLNPISVAHMLGGCVMGRNAHGDLSLVRRFFSPAKRTVS